MRIKGLVQGISSKQSTSQPTDGSICPYGLFQSTLKLWPKNRVPRTDCSGGYRSTKVEINACGTDIDSLASDPGWRRYAVAVDH